MADHDIVQGQNGGADSIRVFMNLERLGELIAHVAANFALLRGLDPPDFQGEEMRALAISGWRHVEFMADRQQFMESVSADLDMVELLGKKTEPEPQHLPEFGGTAPTPLGWEPPV